MIKVAEEGMIRFQGVADKEALCHGRLTTVSQRIQHFVMGLRDNIEMIYPPPAMDGQELAYLKLGRPDGSNDPAVWSCP